LQRSSVVAEAEMWAVGAAGMGFRQDGPPYVTQGCKQALLAGNVSRWCVVGNSLSPMAGWLVVVAWQGGLEAKGCAWVPQ
jgi:hypothetical protein